MKALLTLDGSELSQRIMPDVRRVIDLVDDVELHVLRVLDQHAVKGTPIVRGHDGRDEAVGTLVVRAPRPRIVESHGEAEERVHGEVVGQMQRVVANELPGIDAHFHVEWSDDPARAIIARANAIDADLIMMATHGRSGLSHLLAGSVAEAVIRMSGRPVLVHCP